MAYGPFEPLLLSAQPPPTKYSAPAWIDHPLNSDELEHALTTMPLIIATPGVPYPGPPATYTAPLLVMLMHSSTNSRFPHSEVYPVGSPAKGLLAFHSGFRQVMPSEATSGHGWPGPVPVHCPPTYCDPAGHGLPPPPGQSCVAPRWHMHAISAAWLPALLQTLPPPWPVGSSRFTGSPPASVNRSVHSALHGGARGPRAGTTSTTRMTVGRSASGAARNACLGERLEAAEEGRGGRGECSSGRAVPAMTTIAAAGERSRAAEAVRGRRSGAAAPAAGGSAVTAAVTITSVARIAPSPAGVRARRATVLSLPPPFGREATLCAAQTATWRSMPSSPAARARRRPTLSCRPK
jgi:hypothetical protein